MIVNTGKIQKGDYVKHNPSGYCGDVDTVYDDGQIFVQWDKKDLLPCKLPMIEFQKVAKVITGAKAVLKVNGQPVGYVDPNSIKPAPVLGQLELETDSNDDECPVCDTLWTETYIYGEPKYDCVPCGKTKESIVKEQEDFKKRFDGYGSDQAKEIDLSGGLGPNWIYGYDDDEPETD